MNRILVIALDGATLDLLKPWMEQDRLPVLSSLFRKGVGGTLNSTIPWATPTAFASYATGVNPGKHGIYDFGVLKEPDYTSFVPTNGGMITGRPLWRLLSDAGLRSLVVNVPMTYPAEDIDGAIVSGIPYPSESERLCFPRDLLSRLRKRGWDIGRNASDDLAGNYDEYFTGLMDLVRIRGEASAWLIKEINPVFTTIHFLETDQVQHRFWQFMAGEPRYNADSPRTDAILNLYQEVERAITKIIDAAGSDTILCLMSDHGFGPTREQVWLNNWLIKNGYLVLKSNPGILLKQALYGIGVSPAAIRERSPERLRLALLRFFERQKGRAIATEADDDSDKISGKSLADRLTERLALDFYDVNWSKTTAFSTGTTSVGYVYINQAVRHPMGIVESGDPYDRLRNRLITDLLEWHPVGNVYTREQIWHGSTLHKAPDLVIRWAKGSIDARFFQTRISSPHLIKDVPNDYAGHRPNGLVLFHGPGISRGGDIEADLLDLPPTFLWLLDQPVPSYMDGRVLEEVLTQKKPIQSIDLPFEGSSVDPSTLSSEEEMIIKDSLRNLGYLD